MASLEKTPGGYRVSWWTDGRGSKRLKSPVFPFKKDALEAQKKINAENAAAKPMRFGASVGWEELVARFVKSRQRRSARYEDDIRDTCMRHAKDHAWKAAADVTADQVKALPLHSIRIVLAVLRYAESEGIAVSRLSTKVSPPGRPRAPRDDSMTLAQVAELVAKATKWHLSNGAVAHMIATYGHRAETLIAAKVGDVDLAQGRIVLKVKSGDTIRHPVTQETLALLRQVIGDRPATDPLFPGHGELPWKSGHAFAQWWSHSIAAGFARKAGILDLRRYGISHMLALGLDARTVADITGHRTVSLLLNTYARSDDARRAGAIAALEAAGKKPRLRQKKESVTPR